MRTSPFGINTDPYADYDPGEPVPVGTCDCCGGEIFKGEPVYITPEYEERYCVECKQQFLKLYESIA